jgi:hypothetical protein
MSEAGLPLEAVERLSLCRHLDGASRTTNGDACRRAGAARQRARHVA